MTYAVFLIFMALAGICVGARSYGWALWFLILALGTLPLGALE